MDSLDAMNSNEVALEEEAYGQYQIQIEVPAPIRRHADNYIELGNFQLAVYPGGPEVAASHGQQFQSQVKPSSHPITPPFMLCYRSIMASIIMLLLTLVLVFMIWVAMERHRDAHYVVLTRMDVRGVIPSASGHSPSASEPSSQGSSALGASLPLPHNAKGDVDIGQVINYNFLVASAETDPCYPIWVAWIITSGGHGADPRPPFQDDPNFRGCPTSNDFSGSGYDRSHMCPNADYGASTFTMRNVVAMTPELNRGEWAEMENRLRREYVGKLAVVGCEYLDSHVGSSSYFTSAKGQQVKVPVGCYYTVFEKVGATAVTNPYTADNGYLSLIDYGYYTNTDSPVLVEKLPYWISSSEQR